MQLRLQVAVIDNPGHQAHRRGVLGAEQTSAVQQLLGVGRAHSHREAGGEGRAQQDAELGHGHADAGRAGN